MPAVVDDGLMPTAPRSADDLGAVFVALQNSLRHYMRKRVADATVVEDLLQDVFVKAAAAIKARRAPNNLSAWLYTAARTTVVDYYRATRPDTTTLDDHLAQPLLASDELLHRELALCVAPLLGQLPAIYRETLRATDIDGKTMQAVADEQGLSLSAVKSRASRARSMLKGKLLDCCHVEIANGVVTDYHRRTTSQCGGSC